jgi:RNA polymerase sigma factor (sigma-70 family)
VSLRTEATKPEAEKRQDLFEEHWPWVAKIAINYLCRLKYALRMHGVTREDMRQIAAMSLLQALDSYESGRGKMGPYLNVKVRTLMIDELRHIRVLEHPKNAARQQIVLEQYDDDKFPRAYDHDLDTEVMVNEALDRLSPRKKELILHWLAGHPITEFARRQGVTQGRGSQLLSKACDEIRALWDVPKAA